MNRKPPSPTELQSRVDDFNQVAPVGTPVRYYSVLYDGEKPDPAKACVTKTRSAAWLMGGHSPVVLVDGVSGGVALTHVELIDDCPSLVRVGADVIGFTAGEPPTINGVKIEHTGLRDELFDDVASQFEKLEQPLSMGWMQSRKVGLEELQALSQKIALVLRGYRALPPRDRIAFVTQGVFNRPPVTDKPGETVLGHRAVDS